MYTRTLSGVNISSGSNTVEHNIFYPPVDVKFYVDGKPEEFTWYPDSIHPTTKIVVESSESASDVTIVIIYALIGYSI